MHVYICCLHFYVLPTHYPLFALDWDVQYGISLTGVQHVNYFFCVYPQQSEMSVDESTITSVDESVSTDKPLDIPKEIWRMVDHLFRNAVKQVRK